MSTLAAVRTKIATARKALQQAHGSVDAIRGAISELQAERRSIETAPLPLDEAIVVLDDAVTRVIGGIHMYTPPADLIDAAAHGGSIDLRALPSEHRVAMLVAALRPILHEQFRQTLEQHYATISPGLPAAERQQRLREIDHQLAEWEREEENLIAELAEAGVVVDRRPDSDPAILLGLE